MNAEPNVHPSEIQKYDALANIWWDEQGEMGTLHTINPLRTQYILQNAGTPLGSVLDVGCGGGILAESLARAGGTVTGIDLSNLSIEAARHHSRGQNLPLTYHCQSIEELADQQPGSFNVVTCMEMLEHVPNPAGIINACAKLVKPGGNVFFSSVNRNLKAWFLVIFGGEYVLRMLPRGSHQYKMLIRPQEIHKWANESGLQFGSVASLLYNPFSRHFKVAHNLADVNYMMHFTRPLQASALPDHPTNNGATQ